VYRIKEGGPVWMNFYLPDNSVDIINPSKPLMFRVDKNQPNMIDVKNKFSQFGLTTREWKQKWVSFLVWHGDENSVFSQNLSELINGKRVVFRYNLLSGRFKEVGFKISNTESALKKEPSLRSISTSEQLDVQGHLKKRFPSKSRFVFRTSWGRMIGSRKTLAVQKKTAIIRQATSYAWVSNRNAN
jgi:hypothetical protein